MMTTDDGNITSKLVQEVTENTDIKDDKDDRIY